MSKADSKAVRGAPDATLTEEYNWRREPAVAGDLVPQIKSELQLASFAQVFTNEVFKAPAPRVGVQGVGEVPVLEEDQIKNFLRSLSPKKSMGADYDASKGKEKAGRCITVLLTVIFERLWGSTP